MSLSTKVARGGLLLLVGQFSVRAIRIASLAVLGRLLDPADYGVFALALVVIGLFDVISDLQVSAAIVRLKSVGEKDFDAAFSVTFCRGILLAALVFASAPWVAEWMGDARLESVLQCLAINPLIGAFWNPRFILYERDINFKAELYITVASSLLGSLATVAFAFALRNYWALVFGTVSSTLITVVMPYFFVRYLPRFSTERWGDFISFGGWLTLANVVAYVNYKSDHILIGKFLGYVELGFYSMGDRIAQIATSELVHPFTRVFYPGLVAVSGDPQRLRRAYYKAQQVVLALVLPVGLTTAICAEHLVILFAGPKWLPSVVVVQILGPVMAVNVMASAVQALVMTSGSTRAIFQRNAVNFAIRVPAMVLGLWYGGLLGVLVARAFTGLVFTLSTLALARQQTGDPFWSAFVHAWRSILSVTVMTGIMVSAQFIAGGTDGSWYSAALHLLLLVSIGAPTYAFVHWLAWRLSGRPDGVETIVFHYFGAILAAARPARKVVGEQ